MDFQSINDQATFFGVIADPTRLKLPRLLAQQQESDALCVNALACRLGVTQSAVSQHLRILKSANLVTGERRGYRVHYFIDKDAMNLVHAKLASALRLELNETTNTSTGEKK